MHGRDHCSSSTSIDSGDVLTLIGTGFGEDPGPGNRSTDLHNVTLAGVRVSDPEVLEWTPTEITIQVPDSATSGLIFMVADGEESNALELIVLVGPPVDPPPVEIPTLSGYGVGLLVLLLMAAGALKLGRASR